MDKDKKKGRAKGGFLIKKRKGWGSKDDILGKKLEEGVLLSKIKRNDVKGDFVIVSIYNSGKGKGVDGFLREIMEKEKENCIIFGRDFNLRIGEKGRVEENENGMSRKSKNKVIIMEAVNCWK